MFAELFDPVIKDRHNGYDPRTMRHPTDLESSKVPLLLRSRRAATRGRAKGRSANPLFPSGHLRGVRRALRVVQSRPHRPQHPWAESAPGMLALGAPRGGARGRDRPVGPEGRPGRSLLQPGRDVRKRAAAAHRCQ